jgi:hypothetical protein
MQTPVEKLLVTIESFNRQFQIGEKERELVKLGWEQEMENFSSPSWIGKMVLLNILAQMRRILMAGAEKNQILLWTR